MSWRNRACSSEDDEIRQIRAAMRNAAVRSDTSGKLIVAVDFGGVIHSYTSGWQGIEVVADAPVPGAIEWLESMSEKYAVYIVSSRFDGDGSRGAATKAVSDWLVKYGIPRPWISVDPDRSGRIVLTPLKPRCIAFVDDRAFRFEGVFPTVKEIESFKPWNKR